MEERKKRRYKRKQRTKKLTLRRFLSYVGMGTIAMMVMAICAYGLMALLGVLFTSNKDYLAPKEGIDIFVTSNGFHTDLVLPIRQEKDSINWLTKFNDSTLTTAYKTYDYVAFGWGDEGFYMESFDNQMPSVPTTFMALFVPTPTLMHVEFYQKALQTTESTVALKISAAQYNSLVLYIENSFKRDLDNNFIRKNRQGYGKHDHFFHAKGSYHLFYTCNDWTNTALKSAGVKTASKAPFAASVMYHLR